jgi:hypothetical protein
VAADGGFKEQHQVLGSIIISRSNNSNIMPAADTTYLEKVKDTLKELEKEKEKDWECRTGLMAFVWARGGGWGKVIETKCNEEGTEYKQLRFEDSHVEWVESIKVYSIDEVEKLVEGGEEVIECWAQSTEFVDYKEYEVENWIDEEMARLEKEIKKAEKKKMAQQIRK